MKQLFFPPTNIDQAASTGWTLRQQKPIPPSLTARVERLEEIVQGIAAVLVEHEVIT